MQKDVRFWSATLPSKRKIKFRLVVKTKTLSRFQEEKGLANLIRKRIEEAEEVRKIFFIFRDPNIQKFRQTFDIFNLYLGKKTGRKFS